MPNRRRPCSSSRTRTRLCALETSREKPHQASSSEGSTEARTSSAVALLVDRGLLSYSDTVAHHWPEFGQHGKAAITVRSGKLKARKLRKKATLPQQEMKSGLQN